MNQAKTVALADFLTDEQIEQAVEIFESEADVFHAQRRIVDGIIRPNMATINEKLGQENDASYLAYAVVHVLGQAVKS